MPPRQRHFTPRSPALRYGGVLPRRFAAENPGNPRVSGRNISLPLRWSNAPTGTKSFAIVLFDPLGRRGLGVVHWLAYDIAPDKTSFAEGEANRPSRSFVNGKNNVLDAGAHRGPANFKKLAGTYLWYGPRPRADVQTRPYTIILIATDIEPGALKRGLTYYELIEELYGKTLDATDFIFRYPPRRGRSRARGR